jgi:hypothetical protein
MKKNLYYQTVFQRNKIIQTALRSLVYSIACNARLFLEVFIRRNFGERYFSIPLAVIITICLSVAPMMFGLGSRWGSSSGFGAIKENLTWYLYLAGFVYYCWKQREEIKHSPSVFDFAKFSLSTGRIHPMFRKIKIFGKPATIRQIEIFLEPALFLAIGLFLLLLEQKIGLVITVASLLYSLSYQMSYTEGDHFIMDKIDDMICSEELLDSIVTGRKEKKSKGFTMRAEIPANNDNWRKVVNNIIVDEEFAGTF